MQTAAQLGTFQSGGCVRMLKDNAIFIFNWADPRHQSRRAGLMASMS